MEYDQTMSKNEFDFGDLRTQNLNEMKKYYSIEEIAKLNNLRHEILNKLGGNEKITISQMFFFEVARCHILLLQESYESSNNYEKEKFATFVGASFWYINRYGWPTGKISAKAKENHKQIKSLEEKLEKIKEKKKRDEIKLIIKGLKTTADHQVTRKIAGHIYLQKKEEELTLKHLVESYVGVYGKTNDVTSEENQALDNYFKNNVSFQEIAELNTYEEIEQFVKNIYRDLKIKI